MDPSFRDKGPFSMLLFKSIIAAFTFPLRIKSANLDTWLIYFGWVIFFKLL